MMVGCLGSLRLLTRSLSTLIRTREGRVRSLTNVRDTLGALSVISLAAVGQRYPSRDGKLLSELPEAELEIQKIYSETGMPPDVKFDIITGAAATIEGAVQEFRDNRCIHVACHGAQHAKRPFVSWFAVGDSKLTLIRIIPERCTNFEFVFLSAAFNEVIGTL